MIEASDMDCLIEFRGMFMEEMRCKVCNHKFERFTYFVVGHEDDGKEMYMCENCFFELALNKLNCKSVKMDYDCKNYYDPVLDFEDDF